jgi:Ca-activated chloride channel homolog
MFKKHFYLFFLVFFVFGLMAKAQRPVSSNVPTNRILFIYDASNSMNGTWQSGKKNEIAKSLISKALDSLKGNPNVELALRVYGHQYDYRTGQNCEDTKLEVPFAKYNVDKIKAKLDKIKAQGTTPIAKTLEKSEFDFPPCDNCRNIIILITDGIEECDGDPCAVSRALQANGIVLKPFVIGIGLDPNFIKSFECIGNFFDASDEKTFQTVLGIVISQALNNTSAQVNLLDANQRPNESNVNMTFQDMYTDKIIYNFIHALNSKGLPDTLKLEPLHTYRIKVHTIPPVEKDSVIITPGIHNIIGIPAAQGFLDIKMSGLVKNNFEVIVRKAGEMKTLNVQETNSTVKYLTGKYDLEVLSYPRVYFNNVEVLQSHTTTIEFPPPGIATIIRSTSGRTDIYKEENNALNWVYQLAENSRSENLYLQPGNYRVIHKPKSAISSSFTSEQKLIIKSGSSTSIRF